MSLEKPIDRRQFLGAASAPALLPLLPSLRWLPQGDERSLLVLELVGGNDGLNTVIPVADPVYAAARPELGDVRRGALQLDADFSLHGAMAGLHRLWKDDRVAIVHAVGYPEPDRSHFRSRDIWHTADPTHRRTTAATTGWLGRVADRLGAAGASVPGLSVGSQQVPLCLRGSEVVVPTLQRVEDYQLVVDPVGGAEAERRGAVKDLARAGTAEEGLSAWVDQIARSAVDNAERLRGTLKRYRPEADYPDNELGRHLQLVAQLAISGFGTRLFHVGHGGFDTHAQQAPAHAGLLRQLADALEALMRDLKAHRREQEVLVLVHSEFGRRVAENRSKGTDHGAGAPVFLLGGEVKPGLHGEPPDLTRLLDGDVRPTTDFRQVYAACLRWLRVDPAPVLGGAFEGLEAV